MSNGGSSVAPEDLERRVERAERTARALQQIGLAVGSTLDLDELLELILKKTTELVEADRATLYLLDDQQACLISRIMIGGETRQISLPVGEGIAGHVALFGRSLRVKDAYEDPRFRREWDDLTGYRTRSILAVPMRNHVGKIIGVVQVLNKRSGRSQFTEDDEELLSALAVQAAISIDNSRLFQSVIQKNMQLVDAKEELERHYRDLKLLYELESATAQAETLEDLARAVILEASRACDADAGALLIAEPEGELFLYFVNVAEANETGHPDVRRVLAKRGEGVLGLSMARNETVVIPDDSENLDGKAPLSAQLSNILGTAVKNAAAMPLEGEDGSPIGALGLYNSRDVRGFSKNDRALMQLISANATTALRLFLSRASRERTERLTTIGRLLSGVMHDMRTPLTVISGFVQLMAKAEDAKTRSEHAELILHQFDLLMAMQRDVLEFVRGERTTLVRKVYLTQFFADLARQLEPELAGSKVRLVVDIEDRSTARFDELKITRAIHNLVRNATEAMAPKGGKLCIRVFRERQTLCISVTDTGRGIPENIRQRLFESFATSGKRGGTGLGLSIVKQIVDEHHGSIDVESTERGTRFTLRIPQDTISRRPPAELPRDS